MINIAPMFNSKKKQIALALVVIVITSLSLLIYLHIQIPFIIQKNATKAFQEMGFNNVEIQNVLRKGNVVRLEEINLDEDGFYTIQKLDAQYNFLSLLVYGHLQKITIDRASFTQSISSEDILQTPRQFFQNIKLPSGLSSRTQLIEISDVDINLLTSDWGGLKFNWDILIRKTDSNNQNIQANIKSTQKQLSTHTQITGDISEDGGWNITANIERTRLNVPDLQITRVNGAVNVSGSKTDFFANGEFNIGGFKMGNFAWSDIAGTFEQDLKNFQWILAGKALGNDDLEFGLNYTSKAPENVNGTLYAQKLGDIVQYWNGTESLGERLKSPVWGIQDVFATYSMPIKDVLSEQKNVRYNFRKIDQNIDIKGNLIIDNEGMIFQGTMPPTLVNDVPILSDEIFLKKGNMGALIKLRVEKEPAQSVDEEMESAIRLNIDQGTINLGPIALIGVSTNIDFSPPEQLTMAKSIPLSFKLPLKNTIIHSANTLFRLDQNIKIEDTAISIFGGKVSINDTAIGNLPHNFTFNTKDLDLKEISNAFGDIFDAEGTLSIKGTLQVTSESLKADNIVLSSTQGGKIKIPEKLTRNIFKDEGSIDSEATIEALKNLDYEYFEISLNGDLSKDASLKITIKGSNPNLLNNRSLLINLTLNEQNVLKFLKILAAS